MTKLLYIGNKLSQNGKTQTTIETLSALLGQEGFEVISASEKQNKIIRLWDMLWHVLKYRRSIDYVLIDTYSTFNFYYAYLVSQLCRCFKVPYIPILHGGDLPKRLKTSPRLSKILFKNAYTNVAPSLYTKARFGVCGFKNVICIPNTIEIENYPFKPRLYKKIKLLWVRSFSKIYNPKLGIDILKLLLESGMEADLCMVGPEGDGSLKETKAYAKKKNVDVTFTGKLSKKDWVALSEHYNVFINTTMVDNMPVSVLEAMALGLPVITTHVGGMPYLIDNHVDGILVKSNHSKGFVNAIQYLINNQDDVNKMVQKARMKVEHYDWQVVKKQWISLLS
ncbi:glycosyltransferase family 4 protein [Tamlana fucoidanivorans]|uniref:Glycosyltransferase family 4 protein n=1 Tax=Allotamlana fucoidanivorans TaxID=2583814 RepID=A0A5C4SNR2_9FLAO|nr:glycosyltransferase family 4 protein [Tamlana fucoidanivorans]TNJ45748.1 glycosyltransferase family 4 protein [Tamlana fucoidanivorans]